MNLLFQDKQMGKEKWMPTGTLRQSIFFCLALLGHTNLIVCLKAAARVSLNMRINIAKLSKFEFFF